MTSSIGQHVVLDDAEAEQRSNGIIAKIRAGAALSAKLCWIGGLASIPLYFMLRLSMFEFFLFCVALSLFGCIFGFLFGDDSFQPLTESKDLEKIKALADKHPQIASFVKNGLALDFTLRKRDLRAAIKIDFEARRAAAGQETRLQAATTEQERSAKALESLMACYGPAADELVAVQDEVRTDI